MTFADTTSKGCIVQGVNDTTDPAVSVYAGGDVTYKGNTEIEGSTIIEGSAHNAKGRLAGRVLWGMGFIPPANATMLAVGGNLQGDAWVGGNTRIGGKMDGRLRITTKENLAAAGSSVEGQTVLPYPDQKNASVKTSLGKANALKVDTDGDGKLDTDYNGYTAKTLIPLSTKLASLPVTGSVQFSKATTGEVPVIARSKFDSPVGAVMWSVSVSREGWIRFTGDNQPHQQVFNLDVNKLDAAQQQLGVSQWSLNFENIPNGQAIIINMIGRTTYTFTPGYRTYVNGEDYGTAINKTDESLSRYRSIASRIMWNIPTMTNVTLGLATFDMKTDHHPNGTTTTTPFDSSNTTSSLQRGVLFPGSILLPYGSLYDYPDTNGRILVGKNLTFDIWEHHNAPWIGFDEPQCFAVSGKTSALLN